MSLKKRIERLEQAVSLGRVLVVSIIKDGKVEGYDPRRDELPPDADVLRIVINHDGGRWPRGWLSAPDAEHAAEAQEV